MKTLIERHDCLLLDLDGTVYLGNAPIASAVNALTSSTSRTLFVTNNASSSPAEVATHLRELGFAATSGDVVTSAQSAAVLLAERLPAGAKVMVLGTNALADEVRAVGLTPVRRFRDSPAAVVQGHAPMTGWAQLCEAALALRAGAVWVATNLDVTLPSDRGLVPGNGSMVAALASATGCSPQVAGKPTATMVANALSRGHFESPLAIGDRLDTDIAGANAGGLPSLLVLTGVITAFDAVHASLGERPTYIARDLSGLHDPAETIAVSRQDAWRVEVACRSVTVYSTGANPGTDGLSVVRAIAREVWDSGFDDRHVTIRPGDDAAWVALHRWSLLPDAEPVSGRVRAVAMSSAIRSISAPT